MLLFLCGKFGFGTYCRKKYIYHTWGPVCSIDPPSLCRPFQYCLGWELKPNCAMNEFEMAIRFISNFKKPRTFVPEQERQESPSSWEWIPMPGQRGPPAPPAQAEGRTQWERNGNRCWPCERGDRGRSRGSKTAGLCQGRQGLTWHLHWRIVLRIRPWGGSTPKRRAQHLRTPIDCVRHGCRRIGSLLPLRASPCRPILARLSHPRLIDRFPYLLLARVAAAVGGD